MPEDRSSQVRDGVKLLIEIIVCYAHEDQQLLKRLKAHLRPLQHEGIIDIWYDGDIKAGAEVESEINRHLNSAHIILLLISPNFLNSDYCYSKEMKEAIERHNRAQACVIPIILRPVHWQGMPFSKLKALPTEGKPVVSWANKDEAFVNIVDEIKKTIDDFVVKAHSKSFQKENNQQSNGPRSPSQQFPILQRQLSANILTNLVFKSTGNFLSKRGTSTFTLSKNHIVICEVRTSSINRKRIKIFVDGNEIYSRIFKVTDLLYGKQIHAFKIEHIDCICYIASTNEIYISMNKDEIIKLTF